MAATRVIQAVADAAEGRESLLQQRIARACLVSAGLFALSIVVPVPWRYGLWALGIATESGATLTEDREAARRARHDRDWGRSSRPTRPRRWTSTTSPSASGCS
jgi:hypothetical protein